MMTLEREYRIGTLVGCAFGVASVIVAHFTNPAVGIGGLLSVVAYDAIQLWRSTRRGVDST